MSYSTTHSVLFVKSRSIPYCSAAAAWLFMSASTFSPAPPPALGNGARHERRHDKMDITSSCDAFVFMAGGKSVRMCISEFDRTSSGCEVLKTSGRWTSVMQKWHLNAVLNYHGHACKLGGIDEALPLRRAKEWRNNNDTVDHWSALTGSRCDPLSIVQDARLSHQSSRHHQNVVLYSLTSSNRHGMILVCTSPCNQTCSCNFRLADQNWCPAATFICKHMCTRDL